MLIATFEGKSTIEVWQKIEILQKLDSSALFGLNDDYTKKQLELHELPTCQSTDWTNFEIMNSGIIEIWSVIQKIYPSDYEFDDREIRTWRAFLKAAGCINITLFENKISKNEFWTKEINPLHDQETLYTLYKDDSYKTNKKGVEGKRRILSIIADEFSLKELRLMK
ncbi:9423_t:CDS:2, partial [Ambispora leptoticha]